MADDVNDIGKKDDDQAEREHFIRIINAFKFYRLFIVISLSVGLFAYHSFDYFRVNPT